jgi:iron only hydrogenase large subunit-like protein
MELSRELITRKAGKDKMPLISSCCPAWVKYAEQWCEDLLPAVSSCKSPQQMLGAILKSWYPEISGMKQEKYFLLPLLPALPKNLNRREKR